MFSKITGDCGTLLTKVTRKEVGKLINLRDILKQILQRRYTKMNKINKLWLLVGFFLVVSNVVSSVIFCGPAYSAAEERVINIMGFWDITGPGSHQRKHGFRGVEDYVKWLNEKGGIDGIKMNHLWVDTVADGSRAVSAFHRFAGMKPKPLAWLTNQSADSIACKPLAKSYEIPAVGLASGPEIMCPPGWVFSGTPAYAVSAMAFGDWVVKDWAQKKRQGNPKVAYVGPDDAWGRNPEPAVPYWKKIGINVHGFEAVPYLPPDTTATLMRLKDAGVNYAYCNWLTPGVAVFLKDAYKLGLLDKITIVSGPHTYSEEYPSMIGQIAEGHVVMLPWPTAHHDTPMIKEIVDWCKRHYGEFDYIHYSNYIGQFLQCTIMTEVIKRGLKKVGYDKLDGAVVYKELLAMRNFDTNGLSGGPISYAEDLRYGNRYLQMGTIKGGKVVPTSEWFQGPVWNCPQ